MKSASLAFIMFYLLTAVILYGVYHIVFELHYSKWFLLLILTPHLYAPSYTEKK